MAEPGDLVGAVPGVSSECEPVASRADHFCCPPCADVFVRNAKEKPDELKPPEEYVQKP